jgi:hypothetical protein
LSNHVLSFFWSMALPLPTPSFSGTASLSSIASVSCSGSDSQSVSTTLTNTYSASHSLSDSVTPSINISHSGMPEGQCSWHIGMWCFVTSKSPNILIEHWCPNSNPFFCIVLYLVLATQIADGVVFDECNSFCLPCIFPRESHGEPHPDPIAVPLRVKGPDPNVLTEPHRQCLPLEHYDPQPLWHSVARVPLGLCEQLHPLGHAPRDQDGLYIRITLQLLLCDK